MSVDVIEPHRSQLNSYSGGTAGEAFILRVDGISDFNALHSGKHNDEVKAMRSTFWRLAAMTCAPILSMRKAHLSPRLVRRPGGILISPLEQGEIGRDSKSLS